MSSVTTDAKLAFGSESCTAFSYYFSLPDDDTSMGSKNNTGCHLIQEIDSLELPDIHSLIK